MAEFSLSNVQFRDVSMRDVVMRGAELKNVEIHGDIENLTINGVDVWPLVDAELNRRYPDRAKMRPTDPAGFRQAWDVVERLWEGTVERAKGFDADQLHVSVNGEWSFIETLRHLTFATDSWVRRAILGQPRPWHPLGPPWDQMPRPAASRPRRRASRPTAPSSTPPS